MWKFNPCIFSRDKERVRPPLWSSGQSSWLQIQRSRFDSRHYQIFREVVCLERGPLRLVSTTEELLERRSTGSCVKAENTAVGISRWQRRTLYPQKLALTLSTSGGRSVQFARGLRPRSLVFFTNVCCCNSTRYVVVLRHMDNSQVVCPWPRCVKPTSHFNIHAWSVLNACSYRLLNKTSFHMCWRHHMWLPQRHNSNVRKVQYMLASLSHTLSTINAYFWRSANLSTCTILQNEFRLNFIIGIHCWINFIW
jgi:hypothetical protein